VFSNIVFSRLSLTPSVIPNSNYVIMVSDWNCLKYFCLLFYCNHQLHRDFLISQCNLFSLYLLWEGKVNIGRSRSTYPVSRFGVEPRTFRIWSRSGNLLVASLIRRKWTVNSGLVILNLVPCIFYGFIQWTNKCINNCQLLYCFLFRYCCVIFREFVVSTLLSYTSMSVQSMVIKFLF
jgi:hypothetical protein